MKLSSQIKPVSYLKAHAAEIVRKLNEHGEPLVITQNGEAKVVIQDIESYEQTQETLALLKILALGTRQVGEGKVQPAEDVIKRLRERQEPSLMPFAVLLTNDAARDPDELYDHIALHDAPQKADYVWGQIERAFSRLSRIPRAGCLS